MTPLETIEQQTVAKWLECNNYMFSKIPSETYTKSWSQKRKNKVEGLKAGLPDMMIILKMGGLLFIELKRAKKSLSKVSKEQQIWIDSLNTIQNVQAVVCYGSEEAINTILKIENL